MKAVSNDENGSLSLFPENDFDCDFLTDFYYVVLLGGSVSTKTRFAESELVFKGEKNEMEESKIVNG